MFATALVTGNEAFEETPQNLIAFAETAETVELVEEKVENKPLTTKDKVNDYFEDIPIMAEIAFCESGTRQFIADGSVLRGRVNSADVGVMQINEKYHAATAIKLGINIYSLEGNMAYGRYLYETQGTRPWNYSSHCWGKSRDVALR